MGNFVSQTLSTVIVQVALLLVTGFLIPVLFQAMGSIRDQRIRDQAVTLARMAAQCIPDKSVRYDYVAQALHEKFPALNPIQVHEALEAAVHYLKEAAVAPVQVVPVAPVPAPTETPPDVHP